MALNGKRLLGLRKSARWTFDRNSIAATLAGASVPLIVLGPSGFQAPIALALLLALPGRWGSVRRGRTPRWLWSLVLVLATWIPSLFVSILPVPSLFLFVRLAALLYGIAVIHALLAEDAECHTLFLKSFLVALVAMFAVAVLSLYVDPVPLAALRNRAADDATRDAPHILKASASVLLCAVPVALWASWRLGGRWWNLAAVAVVAAFPAVAIGTDSRASLAGLLAIGLVAGGLAAWRHPRYRLLIANAVLAGAGAIAWFVVESWHNWVAHESSVQFLHLYLPVWMVGPPRQVIWRFVFERFLDRPLFGWGIGAINHVPGAHDIIPVVNIVYVPSHPHNWLLEILSETGLVGTLPMLALLALWVWRLARQYLRDGALEKLALITLLFGFFGSGSFNFSIWRVWWHLSAMVLVTAIIAAGPKAARASATTAEWPGS